MVPYSMEQHVRTVPHQHLQAITQTASAMRPACSMIAMRAEAQTARSRQNRGHWTRAWRLRQQKWHIADFKVPRPWAQMRC